MFSGSEFAQNRTRIEMFEAIIDLVSRNEIVHTSAAIPKNAINGTTWRVTSKGSLPATREVKPDQANENQWYLRRTPTAALCSNMPK